MCSKQYYQVSIYKDISLGITYNSYFARNLSSIREYLTPVKLELINIINNNRYRHESRSPF